MDSFSIHVKSTVNLYVADTENHRVQVFTAKGDSLGRRGRVGEN